MASGKLELPALSARDLKSRQLLFQFVLQALGLVLAAIVGCVGDWRAAGIIAIASAGGPHAVTILARHFSIRK